MSEQNGASRLDRLEKLMAMLIDDHLQFQQEHKQLLTAQILTNDQVQKLSVIVAEIGQAQKRTEEKFEEVGDKLNALIHVVDDVIRKRPPL
jgi:hypothetical protein